MICEGDVYKGFRAVRVESAEYMDSTGILLRHEESGLEVFHILNADEENLFAFGFRTPPKNSTGAAHVLEHSVFCGSRKYPFKDPFIKLANQSVNTYLNALTFSDRTIFPASSLIREEYFKLMSVYADAVFFPLLRPEIFSQECWRIETAENGEPEFQGVVFNEMKGSYASFDDMVSDEIERTSAGGGCYSFSSGGDPLEMPSLDIEKLREFHRAHYCARNCMVFLYGNIPTEEQLDFLDENVIQKIGDFGSKVEFPAEDSSFKPPEFARAEAPAENDSGNEKNTCALTWRLRKPSDRDALFLRRIEASFIFELLCGDDSAPVARRILKKFPGVDLAPHCGIDELNDSFLSSISFRGFNEDDAKAIGSEIMLALKELRQNGISGEDIERTCMSFDFSNREVKRSMSHGPYSLVLMKRALRAWAYGEDEFDALKIRGATQAIKGKIAESGDYLPNLIEEMLIENKARSFLVVMPSAEWTERRSKRERELAESFAKRLGKKKISEGLEKMRALQEAEDCGDDLIPSVRVKDLKEFSDGSKVSVSDIDGVPLFCSREATNGIVYASVNFPADTIKPEQVKLLPLLEECIGGMGWGTLSWDEASSIAARLTGSFGAFTRTANVPDALKGAMERDPLIVGRQWFSIYFSFLEEKAAEAFGMVAECIKGLSFGDTERLSTIISGSYSGMASSILPNANVYAALRASRKESRSNAITEMTRGLTSLFVLDRLRKENPAEIQERLCTLFSAVKSGGGIVHLTAEKSGIEACRKELKKFTREISLAAPKPKRAVSDEEFFAQTELPASERPCARNPLYDEVVVIPGSVGYAARLVQGPQFDTKEAMADEVLAHLLETSDLWNQVRTAGGAYGVFFSISSDNAAARFLTYRDPKPFDSLETFLGGLEKLPQRKFTEDEVERTMAGVYSDEISPMSPSEKGASAFARKIYGIYDGYRLQRIKRLLRLTAKDIEAASRRYSTAAKKGEAVVLCGNSLITEKIRKNTGKIIRIPL